MKYLNYLLPIGSATVVAALLLAGTSVQSGPQCHKLEGTWTATADNPMDPTHPFLWTYTLSPTDPSGREAVIRGEFIVPIPCWLFVPEIGPGGAYAQESFTSFYGEAAMTGPNSATVTVYWYGMKNDPATGPKIVNIGVGVSQLKFRAHNKLEATHYMAFYPPNATGIITKDDAPFAVFPSPAISIDTRLGLLSPKDVMLKK